MMFSFLRTAALAFALCANLGAVAGDFDSQQVVLGKSVDVRLPAAFDFEAGSARLGMKTQLRLQIYVDYINRATLDSIMVTGFANTAMGEEREALGLERARSLRAFLILNGIEPSRVHVDYVDFTDQRDGRPGLVQFEAVNKFTR